MNSSEPPALITSPVEVTRSPGLAGPMNSPLRLTVTARLSARAFQPIANSE